MDKDYHINKGAKPFDDIDKIAKKTSIRKTLSLGKIIGKGFYGIVRLGNPIDDSTKNFAVKSISKQARPKDAILLENEIRNLKTLNHPYIVKLYDVYSDTSYVHLVTEYCDGGDLVAKLNLQGGKFQEKEALLYLYQMLCAVNYLHEMRICHRDLKLENFILASKEDQNSSLKLIDFGFSKQFAPNEEQKLYALVGSPIYLAPEVIDGPYDFKCDVWSLGIILHVMVTGSSPYGNFDESEINDLIQNHHIDYVTNSHYESLSD